MKKSIVAMTIVLAAMATLSLLPAAALGDTNIALGKAVTINGPYSGGTGGLVTDGIFMPIDTDWNVNSVYWYGTATNLVIDLGGLYNISGLIVQADDNDTYAVDYWNAGSSTWVRAYNVPYSSTSWGLKTRPNPNDFTQQYPLAPAITTDKLRIEATSGDDGYSVSEVQAFGAAVPVPPSVLLLGSGLAGLLPWRHRRRS